MRINEPINWKILKTKSSVSLENDIFGLVIGVFFFLSYFLSTVDFFSGKWTLHLSHSHTDCTASRAVLGFIFCSRTFRHAN